MDFILAVLVAILVVRFCIAILGVPAARRLLLQLAGAQVYRYRLGYSLWRLVASELAFEAAALCCCICAPHFYGYIVGQVAE